MNHVASPPTPERNNSFPKLPSARGLRNRTSTAVVLTYSFTWLSHTHLLGDTGDKHRKAPRASLSGCLSSVVTTKPEDRPQSTRVIAVGGSPVEGEKCRKRQPRGLVYLQEHALSHGRKPPEDPMPQASEPWRRQNHPHTPLRETTT